MDGRDSAPGGLVGRNKPDGGRASLTRLKPNL
jgi:hypothetical protein